MPTDETTRFEVKEVKTDAVHSSNILHRNTTTSPVLNSMLFRSFLCNCVNIRNSGSIKPQRIIVTVHGSSRMEGADFPFKLASTASQSHW